MPKSRVRTIIFLLLVTLSFLHAGSRPDALALTQNAPIPERQRGIALLDQRKFKEASKIFRKEVDKNKTDPEGWYYLGLALVQQVKETKNAAKAFQTALNLRQDFTAARTGLSYALLLTNKLPEASREAQAVLKVHPEIAEPHYIVGAIHLRSGAGDEALKEAEEAIRLNPQLAGAHLLKSQALLSNYRMSTTAAAAGIPVTSSPPTPEERIERARKRKEGNRSLIQAADSLETYLRLNPHDSGAKDWQEQLATLKVFARYGEDTADPNDTIFSATEVTTKARVLFKPEPTYTEEARRAGVTGTIVLRTVFAANGTISHILVLHGLPNGLTAQALKAARRIKFVPATIDGRPVSMLIQVEYNFNLYY